VILPYVTTHIVGTVSNPGLAGFDLINEIGFRRDELFGGTHARLTRLVEDTILADGDDVNEDGIPDVSAAIATCQEADGRTRFPQVGTRPALSSMPMSCSTRSFTQRLPYRTRTSRALCSSQNKTKEGTMRGRVFGSVGAGAGRDVRGSG
jgi:hypothetical protein